MFGGESDILYDGGFEIKDVPVVGPIFDKFLHPRETSKDVLDAMERWPGGKLIVGLLVAVVVVLLIMLVVTLINGSVSFLGLVMKKEGYASAGGSNVAVWRHGGQDNPLIAAGLEGMTVGVPSVKDEKKNSLEPRVDGDDGNGRWIMHQGQKLYLVEALGGEPVRAFKVPIDENDIKQGFHPEHGYFYTDNMKALALMREYPLDKVEAVYNGTQVASTIGIPYTDEASMLSYASSCKIQYDGQVGDERNPYSWLSPAEAMEVSPQLVKSNKQDARAAKTLDQALAKVVTGLNMD